MPKKILQDVIPAERKSIRHIPLPNNRKPASESEVTISPRRTQKEAGGAKLMRWLTIFVSFAVLVGIFFLVTWFFTSATINVTPKQETATIDSVLQIGELASEDLFNTIVVSTSTVSETVPTNREETVNKKASGDIIIYNNYSSESQRLIKNTRFEASNGRIYLINESVVVPGQKVEGGKKTPGSITVTVYADAAGPDYNLPLSDLKGDFTVPGFKGTPRYQSFYARQKTDITGGFSGIARVIDDAVFESVQNRLQTQVSDALWNSLNASIPEGYIAFRSLYALDYSVSSEDNSAGGVTISVTAVGKALALDQKSLSGAIAKDSLSGYDDKPILIKNIGDIEIAPRLSQGESLFENTKLVFTAKGNAHFVWQFDEDAFKAELAGKPKNSTESVMQQYPAINKAEVVIKPSWVSKYPKNVRKIHINLMLD